MASYEDRRDSQLDELQEKLAARDEIISNLQSKIQDLQFLLMSRESFVLAVAEALADHNVVRSISPEYDEDTALSVYKQRMFETKQNLVRMGTA